MKETNRKHKVAFFQKQPSLRVSTSTEARNEKMMKEIKN